MASCATAPRGPAGRLADAGLDVTSQFGSGVRATASALDGVAVSEAFSRTYESCVNPVLACPPELSENPNGEKRDLLIAAVKQRAIAIEALGDAYAALKAEADYDARGAMTEATNKAIAGVNNFASAVVIAAGPAAPAAALISEPIGKLIGVAAGAIADRNQKKRLLAASAAIRPVTQRLHDALAVEATVFDSLQSYLETNQTAVQEDLLQAGLVSHADIAAGLANGVGMAAVGNSDAIAKASPAVRAALVATLEASAKREVAAEQRRYRASLAALERLVAAHDALAAGQPITLADLDRLLGELVAALPPPEKAK